MSAPSLGKGEQGEQPVPPIFSGHCLKDPLWFLHTQISREIFIAEMSGEGQDQRRSWGLLPCTGATTGHRGLSTEHPNSCHSCHRPTKQETCWTTQEKELLLCHPRSQPSSLHASPSQLHRQKFQSRGCSEYVCAPGSSSAVTSQVPTLQKLAHCFNRHTGALDLALPPCWTGLHPEPWSHGHFLNAHALATSCTAPH